MTFPKLGVDGVGLDGVGVNPEEGGGWCRPAPVKGSLPPMFEGTEVFTLGWYRDPPVKGSPLVFWFGRLPPAGWYRDAPSEARGASAMPRSKRDIRGSYL